MDPSSTIAFQPMLRPQATSVSLLFVQPAFDDGDARTLHHYIYIKDVPIIELNQ